MDDDETRTLRRMQEAGLTARQWKLLYACWMAVLVLTLMLHE